MKTLLTFGKSNAKLEKGNFENKKMYTFSLPAGHSCPFAKDCLSFADRNTGKIHDSEHMQFRCFAASMEATYTNTRVARWHNYDMLREAKTTDNMFLLINRSLPKNADIIRVHVSGDFFNKAYMAAWFKVAQNNPNILFYAYTKSVGYWIDLINEVPVNFKLTASKGGKLDSIIEKNNLKQAIVVFSENEAKALNLKIDKDDTSAYTSDESFALIIHGTQPKDSIAGEALKAVNRAKKIKE